MGHVPPGSFPAQSAGDELSRREHRGAGAPSSNLSDHRRRLARFGESVAADFLGRRGAEVLARNVRHGRGEIDLVVALGEERVAVEVKTRTGADTDPAESFTPAKAARVRSVARCLRPGIHRVDLVTVTLRADGVGVRWVPRVG